MDFRILGPLEARDGDRTIPLAGGRQRAVLALLILNANETISTDRLVQELWGDDAPATAPKVVQNHVSQLRRALANGLLVTEGAGYMLRLEPGSVDLDSFERLLDEGRRALARGDADEASERLRDALALWRGPPLADFAFESFAQTEIARLEERRLVALEERIEADLVLGRHADLVGELEALVKEHPLRERLQAQLMLCLYRSGRQAEALEVYQAARRALVEELGIDPGRRLRELHQAILQQDPVLDLAPADKPPEDAGRGAFVGREPELAELLAGLEDALSGNGRLFLLVGEPGIGKSRLAEELTAHARARGAHVLVGRCWEAGGAPAYWPWVQSLRAHVRESDLVALRSQLGPGAADLAQIVPELRRRFPDLPEPPALESEGARFRLFDATAEFFRNASEARPIVLVLDDLHAADPSSLLLLQFVARQLGSTRMLVLGAYRDVDPVPGQPLTALLAEVAREPVTRRLSLGGLSEQAVAEYVGLTASEIASPELVAALHAETEGNPLFVSETVRLLSIEGVRAEAAVGVAAIPQSVRDVIARRLAHLSEESNRLLVLASVLGREFALEALARLGGVVEEELLDMLDDAMAARVISDVPGGRGRLRFAHVLIRDTLYEGLTTARRVRMHRQAIEALEELYGDESGPYLAELAHHAIAGSEFDKALQYARRAGDRAFALLAFEESARLYETALEALELAGASDEETHCELLLALGKAEASGGNAASAKRAFLGATGIARRLHLSRQFAEAAAGYAREDMYLRAGADEELVPLLEEALSTLGESDVELRARLLGRLAGALRDEPVRDRRDELSRKAVELARRTGNPVALAYALDGRIAAINAPDTLEECVALAIELREVAEGTGDMVRAIHGHLHRLVALATVGDIRQLEAVLDTMSRIAAELRQPSELWDVYAGRAALALAAGRFAEAENLVAQAIEVGERANPEIAVPTYRLQQYALGDVRGQLDEIEPALRDLVRDYPSRVAFRCALAHVHARLGRVPEARRTVDDLAADRFSALPFDHEWLFGMSLLAETVALLGDANSAVDLYELLLPYAACNAADWPEGIRGCVARYLGLLATTLKRWGDAERHFKAALATDAERGALTWLAYTRYDYGEMLLAREDPGDRERAGDLLASARTLTQELGLSALDERISSLSKQ